MALERVLDWPCSERPREQPASELEDAGVGECRSGPDRLEIKPLFTPSERPPEVFERHRRGLESHEFDGAVAERVLLR